MLAAWDMGEAWASFYPTNPFKFTLSSLALSYQVYTVPDIYTISPTHTLPLFFFLLTSQPHLARDWNRSVLFVFSLLLVHTIIHSLWLLIKSPIHSHSLTESHNLDDCLF